MSQSIPFPSALLPQTLGLLLEHVEFAAQTLTLTLRTTSATSSCPLCCAASTRVHSQYTRTLADVPWAGFTVRCILYVRKFFCRIPACARRIFTERLPELAVPYGRTTLRLHEMLRLIAFALGGEAGSRLLARLGVVRSPAALIALIRQTSAPAHATPRVLGVDDWAKRKGTSYGTILVDLEHHRPVDLLPDRTAETLTAWLQEHPGSEIITRDRSDRYAAGATAGAPNALQVADRWHLMRNWADVVERVLKRHQVALRQVHLVITLPEQATAARLLPPKSVNRRRKYAEERRERARQERLERWTTIRERHAKGAALTEIARALRLNYKTVRKYAQATTCPHRHAYPPRQRLVAPYEPYLRARWAEGCRNGTQLYREIVAHGFTGSRVLVAMVVAQFRRTEGLSLPWLPKVARQKPLLPRDGVTVILQRQTERTSEEQTALDEIRTLHPELDQVVTLSERYTTMFRERHAQALDQWMLDAQTSVSKEVRQCVHHLRKDEAAVRAALLHTWSNGQVEGQVHRLKLLKRSMYGRANFDLLRLRVLHAT